MDTEMELERQLGRKLSECFADKKKIAIQTGIHIVFCILMDIMSLGGIHAIKHFPQEMPNIGIIAFDVILTVIIGLYPLIHLRDYLAFYENGIVFRKKMYLWSELGTVSWRDHIFAGFFHRTVMATNKKAFQVAYLENPKKQYNLAYMKH